MHRLFPTESLNIFQMCQSKSSLMISKSRLKIEFIEGNIRLSNLRLFIDSINGVLYEGFSRETDPQIMPIYQKSQNSPK